MKYIDKLEDQFDLKNWPHTFTKTGHTRVIGVEHDELGRETDPIFAVEMECTHCHAKYLNGLENRPPDPCPARSKSSEMKRLLS